tara:strand:- start:5471 stop:5599 length:129 start_codon:yes stop_codon:yes gene_type:complete
MVYLLEKGADPNLPERRCHRALDWAATEKVKVLLKEHGAEAT